jgi:sugar phosphate isomerase/epimerase
MKILLASLFVATAAFAADFTGPLGLQLYSLRESFKSDVPGSLDKVKAFGFQLVELASLYGMQPEQLLDLLKARGLTAVSGHYQYDPLKKDVAALVAEAKKLGLKYVACPWIPHEIGNFNEADVRRAAADFNAWGEAFAKEGIKFCYHAHGYEFRPVSEGASETFFDMLARETKPESVSFQMDVFWVVHPGADPVKLLEKYPGRFLLMHVKDIRKGARTGVYTGKADLKDDVAIGTGQVNWPAVFRAAAKSGVQYYFIEDESPTVEQQIPQSLKYLETLRR